jgi:ABC-2 type transport system permease protein
MTSLLKTEWLKIRKYPAFWGMAAIVALSYPGINYMFYRGFKNLMEHGKAKATMVMKMLLGNPFTFPEVWHTVAYASSIFVFIPSIVVIMFITNEYTYKTHRQNIIDGWSRNQFLSGKLIDVLIISLITTAFFVLVALLIGYLNFSEGSTKIWEQSNYIGLFFLQTLSQLSIAFLIAFLFRKAFIALGVFLFYKIAEKILVLIAMFKANDLGRFLPLEVSNRLIPAPAFWGRLDAESYKKSLALINEHIIYTIVLLTITWTICFWLNKRRDL